MLLYNHTLTIDAHHGILSRVRRKTLKTKLQIALNKCSKLLLGAPNDLTWLPSLRFFFADSGQTLTKRVFGFSRTNWLVNMCLTSVGQS